MSSDYRTMYDSEYLGAWDMEGKDIPLKISDVKAGTLDNGKGKKQKKPICYFEQTEKGLVVNKTNGRVIAQLYGPDTAKWKGKWITLFATTTDVGGETKDCIRVRPQVPTVKAA